ncbi:hypothetical protein J2W40_004157, partial [Sphingobium xenophagum]|nr:hypothetical protein [Sphingobium xenophagum]
TSNRRFYAQVLSVRSSYRVKLGGDDMG